MGKLENIAFIQQIKLLDDRNYLLALVAYGAAPTLLCKKPSTLLNLADNSHRLYHSWLTCGGEVCQTLGLQSYQLNKSPNTLNVLFYNEPELRSCLDSEINRSLLERMGYDSSYSVASDLLILEKHFERQCPHEVGVFLGFPVDDVVGFIRNQGRHYLINSYWKVYSRPLDAIRTFKAYDEARDKVRALLQNIQGG